MKKKIVYMLALSFIIVIFNHKAVETKAANNISNTYEELIGYAKEMYYSGEEIVNNTYDIIDLFVLNSNIILEYNACVDFVDVIGMLQDGRYVNLTRLVDYEFENAEIASFEMGKLKGINQGTTQVVITYQNYSCTFTVDVLQFKPLVSLDEIIQSLNLQRASNEIGLMSVGATSLARANDMMNYSWTPTKTFIPNDQNMSFAAGTKLKGIPYSQGKQTNLDQFKEALGKSDFYDAHYRGNDPSNRDPKYGLDCSGFLCAAWNVPRDTTTGFFNELKKTSSTKYIRIGSYDLSGKSDTKLVDDSILINAYSILVPSAGLVRSNGSTGHSRFVVSVDGNYVNCIDTSNNFPSLERYSFTQLASDGFVPFWTTVGYKETGWK